MASEVLVRVRRYDPELRPHPWWAEYRVPASPMDRVLDLLHYIKERLDPGLAFRRSCAHGICGSDAMCVNGRNSLACKVLVRTLRSPVVVEPLPGLPVIKDLVVDMEPFFAAYREVMPYLVAAEPEGTRERLQTPEERQRFDEGTKCILCAACTSSCPVFWADGRYLGPAAIVQAHRFIFDSRDEAARERLEILDSRVGVWRCRTAFNCTGACPRGIPITLLIQQVKRRVLMERA